MLNYQRVNSPLTSGYFIEHQQYLGSLPFKHITQKLLHRDGESWKMDTANVRSPHRTPDGIPCWWIGVIWQSIDVWEHPTFWLNKQSCLFFCAIHLSTSGHQSLYPSTRRTDSTKHPVTHHLSWHSSCKLHLSSCLCFLVSLQKSTMAMENGPYK